MPELKKGYIQIYTGNGKGKSTAAIGLAIRAAGYGLKVFILQLMKDFPYNEGKILSIMSDKIRVVKIGRDDWVFRKEKPPQEEVDQAEKALSEFEEVMISKKYDVFILDEICAAIYFGLVNEERVMKILDKKPESIELVLTGRYCSGSLISRADLVTEMKEIKHYYSTGVKSRPGIDS